MDRFTNPSSLHFYLALAVFFLPHNTFLCVILFKLLKYFMSHNFNEVKNCNLLVFEIGWEGQRGMASRGEDQSGWHVSPT